MPPARSLRKRHTRSKAVIAPKQLAGYHNQLKQQKQEKARRPIDRSSRLRKSTESIQIPKTTTRLPVGPNTKETHEIIDMAKEKDDLLRHDK